MNNVDEGLRPGAGERQAYETPLLRLLGDVRQLTLGGSPGSGDSGSAASQQF